MKDIKILRLTTGEDIIASVTDDLMGNYEVESPMQIRMDFRGPNAHLLLAHWMPVSILVKNETVISKNMVVCVMDPNEDCSEYYATTTQKMNSLLEAREQSEGLTAEEMVEIINSMEHSSNQPIH